MIKKLFLPSFVVISVLLAGCVSKQTYEALQQESEDQNAANEKKIADLNAKIKEMTNLNNDLQNRLGKVSTNKAELDRSLAETRQALSEMARRKTEMEKELSDFRNLTAGLKSMIETGSVTVKFIKGKMVVSLGSDVLFPSGSAKLHQEGIDAVKQVTKQLVKIQNKDFQVEGHTDNVPIKTREFPSNWELASARALTVVNAMREAGMPGARVSAASYADTHPAAANTSADGKAKNRRIDMVIVPDLSKLMDVDALDKHNKPETRNLSSEKPKEGEDATTTEKTVPDAGEATPAETEN